MLSVAPHPLVVAAASGRLPEWAVAEPGRREHMERVADLLDTWAERLGHGDDERARWRAAGYLHDALRDASPDDLRILVSDADLIPDALLHGPAAAERLRAEGVTDEELLDYFGIDTNKVREKTRKQELDAVVMDVARERIRNLVHRGLPLNPRTVAFWNLLVEEVGE